MELKIENNYLTGYYLQDKFHGEEEETGLLFEQEHEDAEETIKIVYDDMDDLQAKVSYILNRLMDK